MVPNNIKTPQKIKNRKLVENRKTFYEIWKICYKQRLTDGF